MESHDSDGSPQPWETLEDEALCDCRVFSVARARARSPRTGELHDFYRIDAAEWVNVIPLTRDEDVVMIRQFRHGLRDVTLEIPGGMIDPGEAPAVAAARELLEETGYRAGRIALLGAVNPNPALFGNRVHTFVASECERVAEIRRESTEDTYVELVARGDVGARVLAGDIDHALVLAGLYFWELTQQSR
ncbi:MAG: NUDIX hydrolase [Myxococcota bacterium]|nr:NUDIX hydrolase [Myxococcota bacterium]